MNAWPSSPKQPTATHKCQTSQIQDATSHPNQVIEETVTVAGPSLSNADDRKDPNAIGRANSKTNGSMNSHSSPSKKKKSKKKSIIQRVSDYGESGAKARLQAVAQSKFYEWFSGLLIVTNAIFIA